LRASVGALRRSRKRIRRCCVVRHAVVRSRVTAVTQRLMGMILAAIAMQMIVASLKAASALPH